jgi:hypothetical protein
MHTHSDIHTEHEHLLVHVDDLRALAREVPALEPSQRADRLDGALEFLRGTLLVHAGEEEEGLYREVAGLLGDDRAIDPMLHDHRVIAEHVDLLAEADVTDVPRLQELLYGLFALITAHFRKEEELYLPLVEG